MKRCGLIVATFITLFGTGLGLQQAGWLRARPARPALSGVAAQATLASPAAARWRHNQPTHWRGYVLQH